MNDYLTEEQMHTYNLEKRQKLGLYLEAWRKIKVNYSNILKRVNRDIARKDSQGEDAKEELEERARAIKDRTEELRPIQSWVQSCFTDVKQREIQSELEIELSRKLDKYNATVRTMDKHGAETAVTPLTDDQAEKVEDVIFMTAQKISERVGDRDATDYLLGKRKWDLADGIEIETLVDKGIDLAKGYKVDI